MLQIADDFVVRWRMNGVESRWYAKLDEDEDEKVIVVHSTEI